MSDDDQKMRIAKAMAHAGLCSRRDAEGWIEAGRVSVNGQKLTTPAFVVGPNDKIEVDGRVVSGAQKLEVFLFHKPAGCLTTNRDPEGRRTIFDILPPDLPRVVTIGRLDYNTEGLLMLTTDGELARYYELPANNIPRTYRVRVRGILRDDHIAKLERGITYKGVRYGSIKATIDSSKGINAWMTMQLHEGKNREIRNVMEAMGFEVSRLLRVSYGPFELGNLREGYVRDCSPAMLRQALPAPWKHRV